MREQSSVSLWTAPVSTVPQVALLSLAHIHTNTDTPVCVVYWVSDGAGFVYAAEHSHEPSSDSELIKHLKSIIKVL
jgi:hypothetical protein